MRPDQHLCDTCADRIAFRLSRLASTMAQGPQPSLLGTCHQLIDKDGPRRPSCHLHVASVHGIQMMDSVLPTSHASQKRLFFTEFLQNFYRVATTGRATPDMLLLSGTVC